MSTFDEQVEAVMNDRAEDEYFRTHVVADVRASNAVLAAKVRELRDAARLYREVVRLNMPRLDTDAARADGRYEMADEVLAIINQEDR